MKYIMCSRVFPKGHPREGQPTFFVEQILNVILPRGINGIVSRDDIKPDVLPLINDFVLLDGEQCKHHTIRAGSRFKTGDMVSLRVWSGRPYCSKQIEFAQVEVKKTWEVEINVQQTSPVIMINEKLLTCDCGRILAENDGLSITDFISWFNIHPKRINRSLTGQIICWNESVDYK